MGMIDNICNLLGVTFQSCNNLEMTKTNIPKSKSRLNVSSVIFIVMSTQ